MIYMFCYDITDNNRLRKVAKVLEKYGLRVQKSFFQCDISEKVVEQIKKDVFKIMDLKKDSFFIYPLCERCANNVIADGTGVLLKLEPFEIL